MKTRVLTANCDNKACSYRHRPTRLRFAQAAVTTLQERHKRRRTQLAQLGRKMTLEEEEEGDSGFHPPPSPLLCETERGDRDRENPGA